MNVKQCVCCWVLLLTLLIPAAPSAAQSPTLPCSQEAGPAGCIDLTLSAATIFGDVYVDGELVAVQVNALRLSVSPGVPHTIEVRNLTDASDGFGDIFVYSEISRANVVVGEGRVIPLALKPQIVYLKGFVRFTCDIKAWALEYEVLCQPAVAETPLPAVAAGATADFALPVGVHTLHVDLIGAHADLWAPPAQDLPVTIAGGRTTPLRATFNRKGKLVLALSVPNVVGDFYVNEQLIAAQVFTATVFVAPGNHKVEVRDVVDPAANGVYRYPNAALTATAVANQSRPATLRLVKEYLLGFGQLTCRINGLEAGHDVRCQAFIDGNDMGLIEAGQMQTYNLPPGPHAVSVGIIGAHADLWAPASQDLNLAITAGRNSPLPVTFNRKGKLALALSVPNVVGDFYVGEQLIAAQVFTTTVFVAPGNHKVEVRNVVDPAANGVYRYPDAVMTAAAVANQSRSATLRLAKEYLLGFGQLTCRINGLEAGHDVRCQVFIDGNDMGLIEAGQMQTYNLPPGTRAVNVGVVGGHADLWAPTVQELAFAITAGRNSLSTATFNRRGILRVALSDPNVVADIFLNGNPVAGQVNTAEIVLDPNVRHTIEARTLRNINAPDAFEYDDLSQVVTLTPNQTRNLTLTVGRPRERCTGSMVLLRVVSWLRSTLTLRFVGPESKTISVSANGETRFCVVPGEYTVTSTAPGYITKVETSTYTSGGCWLWRFWDEGGAPPPDDGCSDNPADYRRP